MIDQSDSIINNNNNRKKNLSKMDLSNRRALEHGLMKRPDGRKAKRRENEKEIRDKYSMEDLWEE